MEAEIARLRGAQQITQKAWWVTGILGDYVARLAINFITPALHDGSIIIFDDWFQFHGNPTLGEQRAFYEWQRYHADWLVTEFQKEGPFRVSFVLNRRH